MLTQRMQVQLISDRMARLPVPDGLGPHQFHEPWRTCWKALDEAGNATPSVTTALIVERLAGIGEEPDEVAHALLATVPGTPPPCFWPFSAIAARLGPIEYLWKPWILRRMVTLMGAAPGTGKTYFSLDLCRRVLAGLAFPDGTPMPEWAIGRNVIFVDGEGVPEIIHERAKAWRMNTDRLYVMQPEDDDEIDFDGKASRDLLIEMVGALHPALIVVDSLGAVTSRGENSIDDVRDIMRFFKRMARDANCAFFANHHLRKRNQLAPDDLPTLDDFRGHGHITMVARSVIGLSAVQTGPEPDPNSPRRLGILKNNLAPIPKPLGFEIVSDENGGAYLKYGEAPKRYAEPLRRDDCAEWLLQTLEANGGKMKPLEAVAQAAEAGYNRRMVYRARKTLAGQISDSHRRSPLNEWVLKGEAEAQAVTS